MALLVFICLTVGIASDLPSSAASVLLPLQQERPAEKHVCPELAGTTGAQELSDDAKHICPSQENIIVPKPKARTTFTAFRRCENLVGESKTSKLAPGNYVFQSPNYPANYSDNTNISWSFTVDEGNIISIDCADFDVEGYDSPFCLYDWLDINGKRFCGNNSTVRIVSTDSLHLQFISDSIFNRKGFSCDIVVKNNPAPDGGSSINCTCGQVNRTTRIVGGTETEESEYPWQAGVWPVYGERVLLCNGSVLSSRYVLTAAHCVQGTPSVVMVMLGNVRGNPPSGEESFQASRILVHPLWEQSRIFHDFALLQLNRQIPFSSYVSPVCLPTPGETYEDLVATASGLGKLSTEGPVSDALMEVDLYILDPINCGAMMHLLELPYNSSVVLCAGGTGGKGTCFGDSGGPLVTEVDGRFVLVGITSFGKGGCAIADQPAFFARVTGVLDWIVENTADSTYCS
ncbi:suppressor of tumorigenicity 14 protein homolog [Amphibalanus amphitrite]|nr:suppressor of tumorigenicity 14 protein homolog [Amphibalanus amphitrite]